MNCPQPHVSLRIALRPVFSQSDMTLVCVPYGRNHDGAQSSGTRPNAVSVVATQRFCIRFGHTTSFVINADMNSCCGITAGIMVGVCAITRFSLSSLARHVHNCFTNQDSSEPLYSPCCWYYCCVKGRQEITHPLTEVDLRQLLLSTRCRHCRRGSSQ